MKMAGETITAAQNILVRIEAADGTVGWGEAASAPTMTGDTLGGLTAAVRDYLAPRLDRPGRPAMGHAAAGIAPRVVGNGGAHSAVEIGGARSGRRAPPAQRLIDLVTKPRREAVKPMWLLGNKTAEEDVAEAHLRQKEGFEFFKLKIGVKPLAKEIAIAFAVREALPKTPLCADANCGLTLADARKYAEQTRKAKLMFVEQPLAYDDFEGLQKLDARHQGADRRRRGDPFVRRYRRERQGRRLGRRIAQADQARRHHGRGRGRQALPASSACR